jgi:hypothetical protein
MFQTPTTGALGTQAHRYADNGTYTVTVKVTESNGGGSDAQTFPVTVSNVPPTITSLTGPPQVLSGTPVPVTGAASDPSGADTTAGFAWRWALDGVTYSAFGPRGSNTFNVTFPTCGQHTVRGEAQDKDGGISLPFTLASAVRVYDAQYQSPLAAGATNMVTSGRVLPVKIAIGCNGTTLTGLSPSIRLLPGKQAGLAEQETATIPASVAATDPPGIMRATEGGYIYNLQVPRAAAGSTFTIRVRPFGERNTAASMDVLIQIR